MCGIAGYITARGAPAPRLGAMTASLAHRGPDRAATRTCGGGGLGAVRLEIVGGREGDQPAFGAASGSTFVMNGEVYNWPALAEAAGLETESDTRAAHAWIDREGTAALARFRGGFALAHLARDGRSLLLARDEFGLKPLFFARRGDSLLFASEIRALLAAGVPADRDEESLTDLLRFQFYRPGRTLFRGIESLRPGEWLEARIGARGALGLRRGRFRHDGAVAGAASVFDLLTESLALQGRRSVPAGILLSGGLDSTAITVGLARGGMAPDRAWVGWFPDAPAWDERPFARAAAGAAGVPLTEVAIPAAAFGAALPETLRALEQPVAGPGSVSQLLLCRAAADHVRVLFGGQGGDELFGGYERLRLAQALARGATAPPDPAYAPLWERMRAAHERAPGDPLAAYRAAVDRGAALRRLAGPAAASRLEGEADLPAMLDGCDVAEPGEAALRFELDVLLPGLLQVDDRTSARFGVEARSPFLDQRLAARLASIPLAEKSPPHAPRRLFRSELSALLPPAVAARRDKLGFPVPLARWWAGELREMAADLLLSRESRERGLVRPEAVPAALEDDGQGGRAVFFLLMLELWHGEVLAAGRRTAVSATAAGIKAADEIEAGIKAADEIEAGIEAGGQA